MYMIDYKKKNYSKNILQSLYDFLGFPIRLISPKISSRFGLTFVNQERWNIVSYYSKGLVLDVGCGKNEFIRNYKGKGYGIDPYFTAYADCAARADALPFKEKSFDTVTFIASLNHIPDRKKALSQARRILKDGGRIIITMVNPFIGHLNHKILPWLCEDNVRKKEAGEKDGLSYEEILLIAKRCNLKLSFYQSFLYGMNHLYIFQKDENI